jgi:hypothetical protein
MQLSEQQLQEQAVNSTMHAAAAPAALLLAAAAGAAEAVHQHQWQQLVHITSKNTSAAAGSSAAVPGALPMLPGSSFAMQQGLMPHAHSMYSHWTPVD